MRSFDDSQGNHWQAALMKASFGNVLLIFSRIGADGVLYRPLDTANFGEAEAQLATATDGELRALLDAATAWH